MIKYSKFRVKIYNLIALKNPQQRGGLRASQNYMVIGQYPQKDWNHFAKNDENKKIIEKYKKLGTIKKFEVKEERIYSYQNAYDHETNFDYSFSRSMY